MVSGDKPERMGTDMGEEPKGRLRSASNENLILLAVILGWGILLRLWRLDFGHELPYMAHPDEHLLFNSVIGILKKKNLHPSIYNYPTLVIYLQTVVMGLAALVGRILGIFRTLADLQPIQNKDVAVGYLATPWMLLVGRATTAVLGASTVGVVFMTARRLVGRPWIALVAAWMLAVSALHVRLSHYMTVDVPATLFAVAAMAVVTHALSTGSARALLASAVLGGLAASSKYNYAVVLPSVGLACLLFPGPWPTRLRYLALCALCSVTAFLVASPYMLLDFHNASKGVLGEMDHYGSQGHLGFKDSSALWYLGYLFRENVICLVLGISGMAVALRRRTRIAAPAVLFVVLFSALIGTQKVYFDRNVLPVAVMLVVFSAVMLEAIVDWIPAVVREWRPSWTPIPPALGLATLLAVTPSLLSLPTLIVDPGPSGRAQAQRWFDNITAKVTAEAKAQSRSRRRTPQAGPPRLKVAAESYTVFLRPPLYDIHYGFNIGQLGQDLKSFRERGYDMIIIGSGMYHRFFEESKDFTDEVKRYNELCNRERYHRAFKGHHDPFGYVDTGMDVYVFFLTDKARTFHEIRPQHRCSLHPTPRAGPSRTKGPKSSHVK